MPLKNCCADSIAVIGSGIPKSWPAPGMRVFEGGTMLDWKDCFWRTWEDNRRLTLKVARSFPEDALLMATPVPGMRPFAEMLLEIAGLEHFLIHGLSEGDWAWGPERTSPVETTGQLFTQPEATREYTRQVWPSISEGLLVAVHPAPPAFGGPSAPPIDWFQYALENEVHHRGQGYAYLRHLKVDPPVFYDRS
jgi:uncharacterized damage-inducible protein DinB